MRVGRRDARDRPRRRRTVRVERHACCSEGDLIAIDGTTRRGHRRRRAARRARGRASTSRRCSSGPTSSARCGVRANADTPEDARKRARVRRRGHRPVPHRAHVHGRGPPAEDARDDHGRRPRRSAATRSTSCCRCSRRTSRACSRRWRACRSRSGCSTRRCTSSCRSAEELAQRGRARADRADRRPRGARDDARARPRSCQEDNPMLGTRGVRLGDPPPRDLRDAGRGDHRAPRAVRERTGKPPQLEIMIPLVAYERELELMRELVERRRRARRAASELELHGRHDDRAAARVLRRRPDRRARRLLLVRHQRPDPDRARLLARRRRGQDPRHATSSARSSTARRSRRSTSPASASCVRLAAWVGREAQAGPEARHLRRARRRPRLDRASSTSGLDYVSLLALPRADRARGGGAGGA